MGPASELPFRGPCLFCGHPDARHRLFDAIVGRHQAGESVELLAWDYGLAEEVVRWVVMGRRG